MFVTHAIRESLLIVAFAALVVLPGLIAFAAVVLAHVFPARPAVASDDLEIVAAVVQARRMFAEAAREDHEARAVAAYFARYSPHAALAVRSGQSTYRAMELRRSAVACLAAVVASGLADQIGGAL